MQLRTTCYQGFKQDLMKASGVICNSGFELISECLYLGLPILTKPVQGQMEQESNALALKKLALAHVMTSLDKTAIEHWFECRSYQARQPIPDVAKAIVAALLSEDKIRVSEISQRLWQAYAAKG